jgi:excisionase family DNA binding protein
MDTIAHRIITTPVGEFCRLSGLGRTKVYELLGKGTLASITIGKRRLIVRSTAIDS